MSRRDTSEFRAYSRRLFAAGATLEDIARAVKRKPRTVRRWKRQDRKDGILWERLRAENIDLNRGLLVSEVVKAMRRILTDDSVSCGMRADAVAKLSLVLERERRHLREHGVAGEGGE